MPLDVLHLHAVQRGAGHSALAARVKGWFDTDDGKAWKLERDKLFLADDEAEDPEVASRAGEAAD